MRRIADLPGRAPERWFVASAVLFVAVVAAGCTIGIHFGSRFVAYVNFIFPIVALANATAKVTQGKFNIDDFSLILFTLPLVVGGAFAVYATSSAARLRRGPASSTESLASSHPALMAEPVAN